MPSVKTKIDGEYIKIPMYTSGDADSITYNSSATHPNGTVGKELKEQSEKIVQIGHDYSTTEQKTGRKWIDGRDIWEKTFEINSGFVGGNNSFNHNISNFDKSIKIWGHLILQDNTVKSIPIVELVNNNFDAYWSVTNLTANSTELLLYIGGGRYTQTDKLFITMQYIKSV